MRQLPALWSIFVLLSAAGLACVDGEDRDAGGVYVARSALQPVASCGDLRESLKSRALDAMNARLDDSLAFALEYGSCGLDTADGGAEGPAYGGADDGAADREHSDTNNQTAGVDEADIVETDGDTLYLLADGRFQVLDAWPAADTRRLSAVAIEGTPRKMFVHEGRAIVFSSLDAWLPSPQQPWQMYGYQPAGAQECTYGYDCEMTGDGHPLKITVLDLADLTAPAVVRETWVEASLLAARRIGSAVHVVTTRPHAEVAGLRYWPEGLECGADEAEVRSAFEGLRAENTALIEAAELDGWLPSARDVRTVGGTTVEQEGLLSDCSAFWETAEQDGSGFLSVVSFDPAAQEPLSTVSILGRSGFVYASADHLYVAARQRRENLGYWYWEGTADEASTVHRFRLQSQPNPRAFYEASGAVKGRVLNQFSMDEHQGVLRIATTSGRVPDPAVHSTVTTLEARNGALVELGRVDDIAPTEDIRAVRFAGDRGYVVTFKKTDPLFVLELSNPAAPALVGELKIPGFSTYIHPLDAGHLMSIGYDADDQGSFAWFTGIRLQLFDVADPTAPALTHYEVIGSRGSTSEAATNHLAFTWFPSRDLLALPMTVCEGAEGGGDYADTVTFSGLMLYRVTTDGGFEYQGGVEHPLPPEYQSGWGVCGNWWTQSNSLVKRSVFIEDFVYSITPLEVRVQDVRALGTDLAQVDLAAP